MLIVCPNCQTYYTVDRRGFEPNGRTVRCHNCGNSWRQGVVPENTVPPAMAAPPPPMPAPQGYTPYPPPPPGYPPYPHPQQAMAAQPMPQPMPVPEPAPPPPPPPVEDDADDEVVEPDFDLPDPEEEDDLDDAMAANIDELFGEDDDDDSSIDQPDEEPDEGGDGRLAEDEDLSDEDIDGLFDDDQETGISSMIESGPAADDGIDSLDDIPEPDPLPEGLTGAMDADDDEDEDDEPVARSPRRKHPKKKGKGGLIALIVILLLLVGVGGYFFRALIAETVPESKMLYDMIGVDTGVLGDGLEIQNVESNWATESGIDILLLSGTIMNVVDEVVPLPLVQAVLLDADGVELQNVVQEPGQTELAPGNGIDFTIRIDEPSPLSRRMEVTFAPRGEQE